MPGNLEQQLGELSGQLKGLVPALLRLEDRQRECESRATRAETQLEGLRAEFDLQRSRNSAHLSELFKQSDECASDNRRQWDSIEAIKKSKEGLSDKIWDTVKIALAGLLGAALSWLLSK